MLIGHGWDLHQHSENKTLKLGGVNFDEQGFEGHSDGDILLHALCDALLGCLLYTSPSPRDLWISRMPSSA